MEIIRAKVKFLQPYGALKDSSGLEPNIPIPEQLEKLYPNLPDIERLRKVYSDVLKFNEDEIYVVARDLRDSIKGDYYENVKVDKFPEMYLGYQDLNGKSIIFFNLFALGDSLMFTPIYKKLKEKYPTCKIIVETRPNYNLLKNNPYIDKLVYTPVPYDEVKKYDYFVDAYEQVNSYPYNNLRLIDFWSTHVKINLEPNEKYPIIPKPKNAAKWKKILDEIREETGKPIILLHGYASSLHRSVPFAKFIEIMHKYKDNYTFVVVYPKYNQFDLNNYKAELLTFDNFYNLSKHSETPDDLASAIYNLDADNDFIISADTVVPHIAAAFKKQCFVLAGGVAPEAQHYYQSSYFPYVHPIYNHGFLGSICANNCHIHALPTPCPEAQAKNQQFSPCITSNNTDIIVKIIDNIRNYIRNHNIEELEHKLTHVKCHICNNIAHLYLIDDYSEIYYCMHCKTRFRTKLKEFNIPINSNQVINLKDKKAIENIFSVKEGLQYSFLYDKIDKLNKISIIDEYPGSIYTILKYMYNKDDTKLYGFINKKIYADDIKNEMMPIQFVDEIEDKQDLILVDMFTIAFANYNLKHFVNTLLEKINDKGMIVLTIQNASRPNIYMQRAIDTILMYTLGIPNIEISYNTIKQLVQKDINIYQISKYRLEDAMIAGGRIMHNATIQQAMQQYAPIQELINNTNIRPLFDFAECNNLSLIILTKQEFDPYELYAINIKLEKIVFDMMRYNYITTQLINKKEQ